MRIAQWLTIAITPFILNADPEPEAMAVTPFILNTDPEPEAMAVTPFVLNTDPEPEAVVQKTLCLSPFHVMHFDIRHTESKGMGYKEGYTTLEGFGIHDHNPYFMPFLDLRAHIFNDGKFAGNVGLGERTVISSINHIFGLYCYYDVRQEDHGLTVNQISPGVEILGKRMEYRVNGYFPVGRDESHYYGHKFKKFQGHRILTQRKKKYALTGADSEVGAHITQSTRNDVYAGVGAYYFTADPSSLWGGKARLLWRYKEYVSLEASYSYDHIFKNVFQGTVGFSYPLGSQLKRKDKNCPDSSGLALSRAAFAPYRFEIPVVSKRKHTKPAINPTTGQPWKVWFVDNTSNSAGTFESPFPTLLQAQNASGPGDIIYVFSGNGTSQGMDAGITLQNNQALYGAGNIHDVTTTLGSIRIPAFSPRAPLLTNNGGNIINLANNNEVSGMNLLVTQAGSGAITGAANIYGANINHNTILGNINHSGILIIGSGPINVANNQLQGTVANSALNGIFVLIPDGLFGKINVTNNVCSGYIGGISVGPLNPTTASGEITISGNVISNFSVSGILTHHGMSNAMVRITNNTLLNNVGMGGSTGISGLTNPNFIPSGFVDSGEYIFDNNTIITTTNAPSFGILYQLNLPAGSSTKVRATMTNNNIQTGTGNGSCGIQILGNSANVTLNATITNNQIQLQAATGTKGIDILPFGATYNIDNFSNNIAPTVNIDNSTVNFVAPNTFQP